MKKGLIALLVIVGIVAVCAFWFVGKRNSFVKLQEGVEKEWANVETAYQRRADLIPSLVNTVKGYAAHEQQTFTQVTEARANATQVKLSVDDLTEENMQRFQRAQGELNSALSRLLAVSENYPELQASKNFENLQTQLEGTENRIAVARRNFNEVAQQYNQAIRMYPGSIVASMSGFDKKPYFQASEGADKAPEVNF